MRHRIFSRRAILVAALSCTSLIEINAARGVLTFTVEANGWPDAARRNAAVTALQSAVNRYNAYGDFGNYNVYAYYNAGIPTAQASYLGSIGFGGTYPNERVTMHELAHYLGSGTYGSTWNGDRSKAMMDQFDGLESTPGGDSQHFWPYGLNYDSEGSEINKQRQVAMVYAQRADMGIGSTANPWSATVVTQTAADPVGESGFNYATRWSDGRFAHPGATYTTGNFYLRTPTSANSFTFAGESVLVNNTNGINGGLLYKGSGSTGVISFKQLQLAGAYVRHASAASDVFRLAGTVQLSGTPIFDAAQGPIVVDATVQGGGSLTKAGDFDLTFNGTGTYTGDTTISRGTLRLGTLTPVAHYTFDDLASTTIENAGSGGAAMNGTRSGRASLVSNGQTGGALSLSEGGGYVSISSPVTDLSYNNNWTVSAWIKTSTPGATLLSKSDGSWSRGNTQFFLGDGSAGGSGGVPGAVRWGGGFFQATAGSTNVADNAWHQVTYVNQAGVFAIYIDGVLQSLSAGNAGFLNSDVGSTLRLGAPTNSGDGAQNFVGLLDNVRIYSRALSASQVASLFSGGAVAGSLPSTTNVSIALGATLDLNGQDQQVASLTGPAGASVLLGAGKLTVAPTLNAQFGGTISGTGGSVIKTGPADMTLSGSLTFTGPLVVRQGTLVAAGNARSSVLGGANNTTDLQGGRLVLDYAGTASPASAVQEILEAAFDQPVAFSSGRIYASQLPAGHLLGWYDDTTSQRVTIVATLGGDANLDLSVNFLDLLVLAQNYNGPEGRVWSQGDSNYDGLVNFTDLLALAQNYNTSAALNAPASLDAAFAADWALAQSLVPEPTTLLAGLAGVSLARRRRSSVTQR